MRQSIASRPGPACPWTRGTCGAIRFRPGPHTSADATQDDFLACYTDTERLLRARLGAPLPAAPPVPSDEPERQTSWQRGNRLVSLFLDGNEANYGQDDWIGIDIRPFH
ncbi:hypothetical protein SRIMM317S_04220 [Streptomyces rimosus subsp. rimosus]